MKMILAITGKLHFCSITSTLPKSHFAICPFETVAFRTSGYCDIGSNANHSMLWYFYTKLDVFIAGRLWNSTVLGYYTVPVHLARLPAGKVMPLLRKIAMPSFERRNLFPQIKIKR